MKTCLLAAVGMTAALSANAALPPKYQNEKDLRVMVAFAQEHPRIMQSLQSIDLQHFLIRFGDGCQVEFGRAYTPKPRGWVGPADPLEYKRSNCPIQ